MFDKLDACFPLPYPARSKQTAALDFIWRMANEGFRDIVIAAPTGAGKTGIGMAACLWGSLETTVAGLGGGCPGGYYLVTQKLLQDQITADFERFSTNFMHTGITLKTAAEYACASHGDCKRGHDETNQWLRLHKNKQCKTTEKSYPCSQLATLDPDKGWQRSADITNCAYEYHKSEFIRRPIGCTNYAFWITERMQVGRLPIKSILVLDECHSLERQLLGSYELSVTSDQVSKFSGMENNPIDDVNEFIQWLEIKYKPEVEFQYKILRASAEEGNITGVLRAKLDSADNHLKRVKLVLGCLKNDINNWVYWCDKTPKGYDYIVKPLIAAPFYKSLIEASSVLRVHLSAYPGPKDVYCDTLGLEPEKVAWKNLSSTFPVENRPVHVVMIGSMGRKAYDQTLPHILKAIEKILEWHKDEKGLIHCASYALGKAIHDHLKHTQHADRILFSSEANARTAVFKEHCNSTSPTVMLSPSIVEGFSLDDDLARFQIIAKCPFPSLGDRQIRVKMQQNRGWYTLQTVSSLIQACGRIVRSETDHGSTYILDKDFEMLYNEENKRFFPKWLTDAFQIHENPNKKSQ